MAIELNNRTKIVAGVVVLAAVGAGAWFFFLDDFLNAPPPKPAATKNAPATASKQADASKPADAPKQADAAKAPAAPSPSGKLIPTNPDRLIAEVVEISGTKATFEMFGRQAMIGASAGFGDGAQKGGANPSQTRAMLDVVNRIYDTGSMTADMAANLKSGLDMERMSRFLELLRQPIAMKMAQQEVANLTPEAFADYQESARKNPPGAARSKLVQTLDEVSGASELGVDVTAAMSREIFDSMLAQMAKSGKNVPPEARKTVADQTNAMRNASRSVTRSILYARYKGVSDEDLGEYLKLLDTDIGRWGSEALGNAMKPVLVGRSGTFGREVTQLTMANRGASAPVAKAPAQAAPAEEKPVAAPAAAAPAAPVGYQRPANIREAYSRYNDLISATVMRDRAAVKELLDAGKNPNVRQSDGQTPLMIAASNGDADIASMLLAKGADPNLRAGGRSALSMAQARGSSGAGLVQMLERSGAKN